MKRILHKRTEFFSDATVGSLQLEGTDFSCYTLEDTQRDGSPKIYGKTCVPKGEYNVQVRFSPKFKRDVVYFFNNYDKGLPEVVRDGKSFSYVAFHGGNTVRDTEGCVLIAYNRIGDKVIQGTAEKEFTKIVKEWIMSGEIVKYIIE